MKARENPFAMWRVEQVTYRLDGLRWEDLFQRFDQVGRRAALVGDHGSGKTTLMEALAKRWRQHGYRVREFRLSQDAPRFASGSLEETLGHLGAGDRVLLDGAEQLTWFGWRRFQRLTRQAGGLLITTHRAGRLPTLFECRTTPQLLEALVLELAPANELPSTGGLSDLFHRHRGNVRDAIRELYDVFAARTV